jgi:hypothetical protein
MRFNDDDKPQPIPVAFVTKVVNQDTTNGQANHYALMARKMSLCYVMLNRGSSLFLTDHVLFPG